LNEQLDFGKKLQLFLIFFFSPPVFLWDAAGAGEEEKNGLRSVTITQSPCSNLNQGN